MTGVNGSGINHVPVHERAPQPFLAEDIGIPGIQDQAKPSVGREQRRELGHQAFTFPIPEHDPRTEFMQDFQVKLNRWFNVLNPALFPIEEQGSGTGEYTRTIDEGVSIAIGLELTEGGYEIEEQGAGKIISKQDTHISFDTWSGNTEYPDCFIIEAGTNTVYSNAKPGMVLERGFYIAFQSDDSKNVDFHDPYNNRPFSELRAGIIEKPQAHIPYEFYVEIIYNDDKLNPELRKNDLFIRFQQLVERAAFYEAEIPLPGTNPPAVKKEIRVDKGEDNITSKYVEIVIPPGCKIREGTQQESGLKYSITEVYSTVSKLLWRQRGCSVTWNGHPFTP